MNFSPDLRNLDIKIYITKNIFHDIRLSVRNFDIYFCDRKNIIQDEIYEVWWSKIKNELTCDHLYKTDVKKSKWSNHLKFSLKLKADEILDRI